MKRLPKILLAVSGASLALGFFVTFSGANLGPAWASALPLGVVLFGLFLIAFVLQNVMAEFDEDENLRREYATRQSRSGAGIAEINVEESPDNGRLAAAHSH